MRHRLVFTLIVVVGLVGATASAATATAPSTEVIPINFSFTPPLLSNACGFPVTRHVEGTQTIRTFYDANGNFVRELDQFNLVETVSAIGNTLVARTVQNVMVKLLPDGSYTVAVVGTDFRLPVPGAGIAFGSVGRLVLLFAADNTLLEVQQDVGNVRGNFTPICEALAAA
jgi:hypothetical protein